MQVSMSTASRTNGRLPSEFERRALEKREQSPRLRFKVGDLVVYGSHGIARVRATSNSGVGGADVIVLEFEDGLSMTLPVERAHARLRALVGVAEIASVQRALRSKEASEPATWRLRRKMMQEKINAGDAVGLAEIVRDAAQRDTRVIDRGQTTSLSLTERQLYLRARKLLAAEIGAFQGADEAAGDEWIEKQLVES